ncbi:MAG: hypothetical protein N3D85_02225 [Candidatus Bathyarchaeota archaeon]|nr:hypothetical protein [Candidatus Bathyarchaeota archaeon]
MNRKLTLSLTALALVCTGLFGQVFAQTEAPLAGVNVGDYFTFSLTSQWSTTNASATAPPYLLEINKTAYYKVMISSVIGPNISATNIWHFNNDTEVNSLVVMDIETRQMYFMNGYQGFCKANLTAGEPLYAGISDSPIINETITRNYASGPRETNFVSFSYPVIDFYNTTEGTETLTLYIDKITGVFVERIIHTEFPDQTGTETWKLTETNRWTVTASTEPLSSLLLPIAGIVAVIIIGVVAAVFLTKKRKKKKKRL